MRAAATGGYLTIAGPRRGRRRRGHRVFAGSGSDLSPEDFVHGLRPALLALAILAALGALAGRAVKLRPV